MSKKSIVLRCLVVIHLTLPFVCLLMLSLSSDNSILMFFIDELTVLSKCLFFLFFIISLVLIWFICLYKVRIIKIFNLCFVSALAFVLSAINIDLNITFLIILLVCLLLFSCSILMKFIVLPFYNKKLFWKYSEERYNIGGIKLFWKCISCSDFYEGEVFDLSLGGIFIVSSEKPKLNSFLNIRFNLADEIINCNAIVIRTHRGGNYPEGFAVKLKNLSRGDKKKIKKIFKNIEDKLSMM